MLRPVRKSLTAILDRLVTEAPDDLRGKSTWALHDWFRAELSKEGFVVRYASDNPVRLFRSYRACPEQVLVDAALAAISTDLSGGDSAEVFYAKAVRGSADFVVWEDTIRVVGPLYPSDRVAKLVAALDDARASGRRLPDHGSRPGGSLPFHQSPIFGAPAALDYFESVSDKLDDALLRGHAERGWHDAGIACPYMGPSALGAFLDAVRTAYAGAECVVSESGREPGILRVTWGEDRDIRVGGHWTAGAERPLEASA